MGNMELLFYKTSFALLLIFAIKYCHGLLPSTGHTEVCLKVPFSVDECYAASLTHPISPRSAKIDCLQRLMLYYEPDQNLTTQDLSYFSALSRTGYSMGVPQPKTGFRLRKEYRVLSDAERQRLHNAFTKLYKKGIMKKYADMHERAVDTAHGGASFLAWHRVFLAMFEDELRLEDKTVALPYWDATLDDEMDNGVNSLIWSSDFLGNGNGDVVTGPFAGWKTSRGNLGRDIGNHPRGRLITEKNIQNILTKCNTDDIVFPLTDPSNEDLNEFVIEYFHNGVHNWVGGDMADVDFAAYDPVFYMVHAFVDLEWEMFRIRQKKLCGKNPETDYAIQTGGPGHGPNDPMSGFDGFTNIDGLKKFWTENWYNYDKRPECPNCRSKYLYCDIIKNRCVSHSRRTDYNAGQFLQNSWVGSFGLLSEPFEPRTIVFSKRVARPFLPAPLSDGRTRESAKRDAKLVVSVNQPFTSATGTKGPIHENAQPNYKTRIPFALDSIVQNLDPHSRQRSPNISTLSLNININKQNLPVLRTQQLDPVQLQRQTNQNNILNKMAGKVGNNSPNVVNLMERLKQYNMQSNQNIRKGLTNRIKSPNGRNQRRKYFSLI